MRWDGEAVGHQDWWVHRDLLVLESGESVEKMKIEDAKIVCAVESNEGPKLRVLNFDNNDEN